MRRSACQKDLLIKGGNKMINWIKNRLTERTTWDGAGLVAVGVIALMFDGLIAYAAYAAIAYGAWTMWKSE